MLMETNGSAVGYDWPIVDPSFRPDAQSLAALREDVVNPWQGSSTTIIRGKFLRKEPYVERAGRHAARWGDPHPGQRAGRRS